VERVRCFVAVDVEDPALVSRIVNIQEQLKASRARLKLVEPQNLHLTLRFIGEVAKPLVSEIAGVLEEIEFASFKLELAGVGAFPNRRRPRVVWIGVREGHDELAELSRRVNEALAKLKIPKPREDFVPHLTIARVKGAAGDLPRVLAELEGVEVGEMLVSNFRLKKSTLTPRGPVYETLFEKRARE